MNSERNKQIGQAIKLLEQVLKEEIEARDSLSNRVEDMDAAIRLLDEAIDSAREASY